MCEPAKEDGNRSAKDLIFTVMSELHKGHQCLFMEPKFIDNPEGPYLVDMEANAKHADKHLKIAFSMLYDLIQILKL